MQLLGVPVAMQPQMHTEDFEFDVARTAAVLAVASTSVWR